MSPPADRSLDLDWTVNDVLHRFPVSVRVFNAFGVDACCGGAATLRAAAHDAGLLPQALLFAIESVLADEAEQAAAAHA